MSIGKKIVCIYPVTGFYILKLQKILVDNFALSSPFLISLFFVLVQLSQCAYGALELK